MFSGAKYKLQQWRQRKTSAKAMSTPLEAVRKQLLAIRDQLTYLQVETAAVIYQLNQQVSALKDIDEDPSAVTEKITVLKENVKTLEKGDQDSKEFVSLLEYLQAVQDQVRKETDEIEELRRQASLLFIENKKLRTELHIFQDHQERSELKAVDLEIQVEHLKFVSSLPPDVPFFGTEETKEAKEDEEKFALMPKETIPFLERDIPEGSYILSVLDKMDAKDNSRLKILFDLIKSYIKDQAYDIAIPLLKTTIEDLISKYSSHEKTVFTIMELLAIAYNVTQRWTDALQVQKEILDIRTESMPDDKLGLAQTLSSLAILSGKVGKIKSARKYCRQAIDLKTEIYGEYHLETAKELHNMGMLYFTDAKSTKAKDYILTALITMRKLKNRNAFCLARAETNLALLYKQEDQLYEAKYTFNSALKLLNKELGKLLKGENIQMENILADDTKLDGLSDDKNANEIKKLLCLLSEVTEESKIVSHVEASEKDAGKILQLVSDD